MCCSQEISSYRVHQDSSVLNMLDLNIRILTEGEIFVMHNNVRMTWGKAFLGWAPSPAAAMQLTMDLNHQALEL